MLHTHTLFLPLGKLPRSLKHGVTYASRDIKGSWWANGIRLRSDMQCKLLKLLNSFRALVKIAFPLLSTTYMMWAGLNECHCLVGYPDQVKRPIFRPDAPSPGSISLQQKPPEQ